MLFLQHDARTLPRRRAGPNKEKEEIEDFFNNFFPLSYVHSLLYHCYHMVTKKYSSTSRSIFLTAYFAQPNHWHCKFIGYSIFYTFLHIFARMPGFPFAAKRAVNVKQQT
jgi:hypothetical protein